MINIHFNTPSWMNAMGFQDGLQEGMKCTSWLGGLIDWMAYLHGLTEHFMRLR